MGHKVEFGAIIHMFLVTVIMVGGAMYISNVDMDFSEVPGVIIDTSVPAEETGSAYVYEVVSGEEESLDVVTGGMTMGIVEEVPEKVTELEEEEIVEEPVPEVEEPPRKLSRKDIFIFISLLVALFIIAWVLEWEFFGRKKEGKIERLLKGKSSFNKKSKRISSKIFKKRR